MYLHQNYRNEHYDLLYSFRFKMNVVLAKKNCFKWMSLSVSNTIITLSFQLYPSINIMLHYFQSIIFSLMKNKPIVD